jgi:hypothetical protein
MSPREREILLRLEPELRRPALKKPAPRRDLSPWLERTLLLLRVYVVVTIALVVFVLVRGIR